MTEIAPPRHQVGDLASKERSLEGPARDRNCPSPPPGRQPAASSGYPQRTGAAAPRRRVLEAAAVGCGAAPRPAGLVPGRAASYRTRTTGAPRVPPAGGGVFLNTHDGGVAGASGATIHLAGRAWPAIQVAYYRRGTARWAGGRADDKYRCPGAGRTIGAAGTAQPNLLGGEGPARPAGRRWLGPALYKFPCPRPVWIPGRSADRCLGAQGVGVPPRVERGAA